MATTERGRREAPPAKRKADANGVRAQKSAARREAILSAALDEFSAQGFAATRLDDVARRAGVAKGTIYLHFRDKEALFQELIRSVLGPVRGNAGSGAQGGPAGAARSPSTRSTCSCARSTRRGART